MKKIFIAFCCLIAFAAKAQLQYDHGTFNTWLRLNLRYVNGISNDSTSISKDSTKLITEAAAKKYADANKTDTAYLHSQLMLKVDGAKYSSDSTSVANSIATKLNKTDTAAMQSSQNAAIASLQANKLNATDTSNLHNSTSQNAINISSLQTAVAGKEPSITTGSTNQFYSWDKTWRQPTYSMIGGTVPIWNQNTTGSASYLATPRYIYGNIFNGTGDVTSTISDTYIASASVWNAKQNALGYTPENVANKNIATGYAGLDANAKISTSLLPASVLGTMKYITTWDASGGAYPSSYSQGNYWVISVAGTLSSVVYKVGDWLVYNGTGWDKIDNQQTVTSVAGKVGAVTLSTSDVSEGSNLYFTNTRAQNAISVSGSLGYSSGVISYTTPSSLPASTISGLVTAGTNISLSGSGTSASPYSISNTYFYTLPNATASALGGVIVGNGLNVSSGTISNAHTAGLGLTLTSNAFAVDTSNASILSRQRAANTYQPIGSYLTGNQIISFAPTGDVTGSTTGTTTLAPTLSIGTGKVTNTMLAGSISASKLIGTDITTVGTLSAGSIPYSLLTGTIPTWNQNTTGTASNITASSNSTLTNLTNSNGLSVNGNLLVGRHPFPGTASNPFELYTDTTYSVHRFSFSDGNIISFTTMLSSGTPVDAFQLTRNGQGIFRDSVQAMSFIGSGAGLTSLPANTALYPLLNQNTTGNAATATMWGGNAADFSTYSTHITTLSGWDNSQNLQKPFTVSTVQSWLGLGSNAYTSTSYVPITTGVTDVNNATGNLLFTTTSTAAHIPNSGSYISGISVATANNTAYTNQLGFDIGGTLWLRNEQNSSWGSWRSVLASDNYGNYALPISGGSLTGNLMMTNNTIYPYAISIGNGGFSSTGSNFINGGSNELYITNYSSTGINVALQIADSGYGISNYSYGFQIGTDKKLHLKSAYSAAWHDNISFGYDGSLNLAGALTASSGTFTTSGANAILANGGVNQWAATFQTNGVNMGAFRGGSSGSDFALYNGNGLDIYSDAGSTLKFSVNGSTGTVTASSFIKSGGTSTLFLKADGSVDGNSYLTSYTETDPSVPSYAKSLNQNVNTTASPTFNQINSSTANISSLPTGSSSDNIVTVSGGNLRQVAMPAGIELSTTTATGYSTTTTSVLDYSCGVGEIGLIEFYLVGTGGSTGGLVYSGTVGYSYFSSNPSITIGANVGPQQFNASGATASVTPVSSSNVIRFQVLGRSSEYWNWKLYYKVRHN